MPRIWKAKVTEDSRFQVLIVPKGRVAASHCTLREAVAWVRGYREANIDPTKTAVIAPQPDPEPVGEIAIHRHSA